METGYLYFITDEFYEKFDKDKTLMQNKESINGQTHDRPCFFAVRDTKDEEIYWLVPLSSKVEKYEAIVQQKIEKMKSKGKENPECNTIRFGKVMGHQTVFLIQNMFPSTNKYINNIYVDRNTHNNVTLSPDVTKDIIKNAKQVLKLHRRGIVLTYGNIDSIYSNLSEELKRDRDTLSALKSILHECDEILRLNPELNTMYQQTANKFHQNHPEVQKATPIDTSTSLNEQLKAAYALRKECNSILLSNSKLKEEYITAKKAYRENTSRQRKAPVLTAASGTTEKKTTQPLKGKKPGL